MQKKTKKMSKRSYKRKSLEKLHSTKKPSKQSITLQTTKFKVPEGNPAKLNLILIDGNKASPLPGNGIFRKPNPIDKRSKENQQRQVSQCLETLFLCSGITPEMIAQHHKIKSASKSMFLGITKEKIEGLKQKYKDSLHKIRELNSELLEEAVKSATFNLGLSKADGQKVTS